MLDALATPVGHLLAFIHSGLSTFLLPASGPAWALSIVLLTVTVRLVLFPLFVKQIKSQRRMQELAPRVQELKKLHKGDKETMNTEMMKLYKDNNANPIAGCLPLLLQLPVFFALFHVIREFKPDATPRFGLSEQMLQEGGKAKIFGAPLSAGFNSPAELLQVLDGNLTTVRIVCAIMVVLMGASTFYTQKQMIARATTTDPQQLMIQKLMLYVLPFSFAISGAFFPVGVLLYWLTTNIWSMGQQAYVIKRMPPPNLTGAPSLKAGDKNGEKAGEPAPKRGFMANLREVAIARQEEQLAKRGANTGATSSNTAAEDTGSNNPSSEVTASQGTASKGAAAKGSKGAVSQGAPEPVGSSMTTAPGGGPGGGTAAGGRPGGKSAAGQRSGSRATGSTVVAPAGRKAGSRKNKRRAGGRR